MGIEVKGPNPVQGGSEIEKRKMGRRRLRSKGGESEKRKRAMKRGVGFIKNQGWRGA
jgi:hypothetical protein